MMEDLNTQNNLWRNKKTSTREKMLEQTLNKLNLLCWKIKEEKCYRAYQQLT